MCSWSRKVSMVKLERLAVSTGTAATLLTPLDLHHTPPHAAWLDQAELFFSILTRRLLRRGEFTSCDDLAEKIDDFVDVYNRTKTPFRWTYEGRPRQAA